MSWGEVRYWLGVSWLVGILIFVVVRWDER